MENIFTHEATPTWSGFVYQGEVALYLAVKKICELRDKKKIKIDEIGKSYQIEIEYFEDIAIVKLDDTGEEYLSLHQVKNQKDADITSYKVPLTQLMLEKGLCKKENSNNVQVYLHISNKIKENIVEINNELKKWKIAVQNYYSDISDFLDNTINTENEELIKKRISEIIKQNPIKLKRAKYTELLKEVIAIYEGKNFDTGKLKTQVQNLKEFLDKEFAVTYIDDSVKLYEYEDEKMYCEGTEIYEKIIKQIEIYKRDTTPEKNKYKCIADKLLHLMRKHIIDRHQKQKKKEVYERRIWFYDVIDILDTGLSEYDQEANILALRRIYDETLIKYCKYVCENPCQGVEDNKCKLRDTEYIRTQLADDDFVKMCYGYYPQCNKKITDRECINKLLQEAGLLESIFEVLKKISKEFIIREEDSTRFVVNDDNNNAFLTGISNKNSNMVVEDIINAINSNAELVSPIFMADELITVYLMAEEGVWDNYYTTISEKYMNTSAKRNKESTEHSICEPKKPKFIKAETIINKYSGC